jgi:hypothetical protein
MLKVSMVAVVVVVMLVLRAIAVPLLSAFFGANVGYMFPETTQAFMQYIKFETVAFWQLMLIVGTASMIWSLGLPTTFQQASVLRPSNQKVK